jgi:hypothetical protein
VLKKGKTETRVLFIIGALVFSLFTLSACTVTSETESAPTVADTVSNSAEDQFIGTVTGYGVQTQGWGGDNENTVYVDNKRVDLDLIWPYSANCMERETLQDDAFSSARDALVQTLPIGQRVLVILSNYENGKWVGDETEGFIHILEDGDEPEVSPPADSVNERLVLTGYWVPEGMGIEFDEYQFNATYGAFNPDYLSQIQEEYLPHIFEAGNKARSQFVGATAICSALALDYEIDDFYISVSYSRDDEENDRLVRIERNKPVYCRDGDGDGICFER